MSISTGCIKVLRLSKGLGAEAVHINLVASVPHTGTNTLVSILDGQKIELGVFMKYRSLLRREVHPGNIERGLVDKNIVWGHISPETIKFIQVLALSSDLYVPIRDPLAGLCSSCNRDEKNFPNIVYDRLISWGLLFNYIYKNKELSPIFVKIEDQAIQKHSGGDYPLKSAYLSGDKKKFENLPGWHMLKSMESEMRPMFEEFGYKNLMWWS